MIIQINGKVYIDGLEIPKPPIKNNDKYNCTIINNKIYINGYEYKQGKWCKTLKAMYYKIF